MFGEENDTFKDLARFANCVGIIEFQRKEIELGGICTFAHPFKACLLELEKFKSLNKLVQSS